MKKIVIMFSIILISSCANLFEMPKCYIDEIPQVRTSKKMRTPYSAGTIYFDHGSTDLKLADMIELINLAQKAIISSADVRVYGHSSHRTLTTDEHIKTVVNYQISEARAKNVMSELISLGVNPDKISYEALADSLPVDVEKTAEDEALNRRVEIVMYQ